MKKPEAKTIVIDFEMEKTTKNKQRYQATTDDASVETLYVNKTAFTKMPKRVRITLTEIPDDEE